MRLASALSKLVTATRPTGGLDVDSAAYKVVAGLNPKNG